MIQPETITGLRRFHEKRRGQRFGTWFSDLNGIVHIPMSGSTEALIDEADKEIASLFVWYPVRCKNTIYAKADVPEHLLRRFPVRAIFLHRLLLTDSDFVDHRDRNGLNCTRLNLRKATKSLNAVNRPHPPSKSPYKGIARRDRRWMAHIQVNRKQIYLGLFETPQEAALAYNAAAIKHFGEFAVLNEVTT